MVTPQPAEAEWLVTPMTPVAARADAATMFLIFISRCLLVGSAGRSGGRRRRAIGAGSRYGARPDVGDRGAPVGKTRHGDQRLVEAVTPLDHDWDHGVEHESLRQ